jgi:16S rRNA (uracil1498-N3)-methyltransferase
MTSSATSLSLLKHLKDNTEHTHITLAVGMPKGPRSDWLVEKATEVGISSLIPLESDRSVLKVKDPKYA